MGDKFVHLEGTNPSFHGVLPPSGRQLQDDKSGIPQQPKLPTGCPAFNQVSPVLGRD